MNAAQSVASVGAFTVAGGVVSTGNEDVNRAGTLTSLTFTGSFNAPDTTLGRGTGTFTDNSPATSSFVYYIVDANNIRFMAGTVGVIGLGRAELQSGTPALSGSYAFGSKGDTGFYQRRKYGRPLQRQRRGHYCRRARFSQDGVTATNISFTGTYTQAAERTHVRPSPLSRTATRDMDGQSCTRPVHRERSQYGAGRKP